MRTRLYEQFEERVEQLTTASPLPTLEERYKHIEALNAEYYGITGNDLPSPLLVLLADWILTETLKDRSTNKVSTTDFAILSNRQLKRRDKRESIVDGEVMDYLNQKYIKNKDSLSKKAHKEFEY